MVVNSIYYGEATVPGGSAASDTLISTDVIAAALLNIYRRDFNPKDDVEPTMFNAIAATLTKAADKGYDPAPSLGEDPMLHALRHSAEVFAAFKVHRAQNDMAARLLDSNGNLKPFEQWKNEVLPIASHQCGGWLKTEYNTAVLRARQAANWQQFQREKDVLPNLKWIPSTSPNPGADHRPFWNTILPIDHPFWDGHRPGDRWNCKCDLTSTDAPATPVPQVPDAPVPGGSAAGNTPQPGLTGNPGKTRALFSDDHPYFPKDCRHCPFYKPSPRAKLMSAFTARTKDCYNCPYINGCIDRTAERKKLMKERSKEARKTVQGRLLSNPGFTGNIIVSRASIDEWTNQPFKYMAEKHQMLLNIVEVIRNAEYIGTADNHKNVKRLVTSHIFKTKVLDIYAFIIVREYDSGEFVLHSISDAQDFEEHVKKR